MTYVLLLSWKGVIDGCLGGLSGVPRSESLYDSFADEGNIGGNAAKICRQPGI